MDAKATLESRITAVISRPMAYPEIEREIGRPEGFALGITLTKMVVAGKLHYKAPDSYQAKWPLYSNKPIPKKCDCPKRETLKPTEWPDAPAAERWPDVLDSACETMEMAGMHDESSYKALKRLHGEMAQLMTPNAQVVRREAAGVASERTEG